MVRKGFCHARGLCSLLIALSGLLVLISGIQLFLLPHGGGGRRNAAETLFGLSVWQWTDLHLIAAIVFAATAILHLVYNGRVLWRYMTSKTDAGLEWGREIVMALGIMTLVIMTAVSGWAPMTWVNSARSELVAGSAPAVSSWPAGGRGGGYGRRRP